MPAAQEVCTPAAQENFKTEDVQQLRQARSGGYHALCDSLCSLWKKLLHNQSTILFTSYFSDPKLMSIPSLTPVALR